MKKYYVYELINLYGTIEDVGETKNPKVRMYQHIKKSPRPGNGKYYGRQDLIMNIVESFDNRQDALKLETELKISYGLEPTELNRHHNSIRLSSKPVLVYKKDGTFVDEYYSSNECARVLNLKINAISLVCNGKLKSTNGYIIKHKENA